MAAMQQQRAAASNAQLTVKTYGDIKNESGLNLIKTDKHLYIGTTEVVPFPAQMDPGADGRFVLDGPALGYGAGVVYSDGVAQWLVAFENAQNKIYVTAGPAGTTVDWHAIVDKVVFASNVAVYTDSVTGAKAVASINDNQIEVVFSY